VKCKQEEEQGWGNRADGLVSLLRGSGLVGCAEP